MFAIKDLYIFIYIIRTGFIERVDSMYNFFSRQYIFRQSNGEMMGFYCDSKQNLCCSRLSGSSSWTDTAVIGKNVHPYFYAELDEDNAYHLLYQDNNGNMNYINIDGPSRKTVPVLGSKTPSAYNKQLYIAPLENDVYLFYVLQHDNSFLLAYQTVSKSKVGTPKIVDYVSGSNIPCSIIYDPNGFIYAFYQSYDGKYLQLGYKKLDSARKHWSDFTPVTKYMGNCEYPHAMIDTNGTIHLCYQRRTQKQFEIIYQQKVKDKNLWSEEAVIHSSIYPFENCSIIQAENKINIYWVRDDVIYYVSAQLSADTWSKPARYVSQPGRQLQCICWKEQSGQGPNRQGAAASSPGIYPGTVSNGVRLAFHSSPVSKASPQFSQLELFNRESGASSDMRDAVMDSLKHLQENMNEINTGWAGTKKELARLTGSYIELNRELGKLSIRLNVVESKLKEMSNPYRTAVTVAGDRPSDQPAALAGKPSLVKDALADRSASTETSSGAKKDAETWQQKKDAEGQPQKKDAETWQQKKDAEASAGVKKDTEAWLGKKDAEGQPQKKDAEASASVKSAEAQLQKKDAVGDSSAERKSGMSLDPEARKLWEAWQEPKEWSDGS